MPLERLGPYRIERPLGHGGMGTVYLATHLETGQPAALKLLSEALAADPRFRERFQIEVETLKRLRHENIVTLIGYGEEDGRLFFVMEYVEGASLEAELRGGRRFTWRETVSVGVQVCAALKHAHDHGVIHRDLKPGNLLLDPAGRVKLTDFGIARLFGATGLTLAGSMIGTPDYMSPEQTEGRPVTPRSDLYSLGCVLFALMAGRPPFVGKSVTQVIDRVRFEEPPPLSRMVPEVPEPFSELIGQLLRKDPDQRIATPQMLSNLLLAMQHALTRPSPGGVAEGPAAKGPPTEVADARPAPASPPTVPDDRPRPKAAAGSTAERPTVEFPPPAPADPEATELQPVRPAANVTVPTAPPAAREAGQTDPGPVAAKTHFTMVTEDVWRREGVPDAVAGPHPRREWLGLAVLGLTLAAVAVLFVYLLRPPSADGLYARIAEGADDPASGPWYEERLQQFLERFPEDPRCGEVQQLLAEQQCRQLREDLGQKVRRLTDLEREFLAGMDCVDRGQLTEARELFPLEY